MPASTVRTCLLALVAAAVALPPASASAARDDLRLVTGAGADGNSGVARISADGRYVVFESAADNLSDDDVAGHDDVFRRDLVTGEVILVSRADGAAGAGGDAESGEPVISADGRHVAFVSYANNLGGMYETDYQNVFVRDVDAGRTTLVAAGNQTSEEPSISADGRYVAFTSLADDLHGDDADGKSDVFVRDRDTGELELASRGSGATGPAGDDHSGGPMLSADGRHVAFESRADTLVSGEVESVTNAFVRDLDPDTTELVSRAGGADGAGADKASNYLAITADGGKVAFTSSATNLSDEDADPGDDVFLRDRAATETRLVSRGDAESHTPSLSADGRYVSFESDATNLSDAHGPFADVFVHDMLAGRTVLVSRGPGPDGAGGDKSSGTYGAALSADGRFVTFESDATNLSDEDGDAVSDVFRRDVLGTAPACGGAAQAVAHGAPATVALPCTDDDGDAPVRTIGSGPQHGTLGPVDDVTGTVVYTPAPGYTGPDSFTYRAADASFASEPATVSLSVGAPDVAPTAGPAAGGALPPAACANALRGTRRGNVLAGTAAGDRLTGLAGNDVLRGLGGADCLFGGPGRDRLSGGPGDDVLSDRRGTDRFSGGSGDDRIDARDRRRRDRRRRDRIACGPGGADRVLADRRDRVARDCERVRRR